MLEIISFACLLAVAVKFGFMIASIDDLTSRIEALEKRKEEKG